MSDSDLHLLDQLAEEYISRLRTGERPTVDEYIAKFPGQEAGIRELFPTLQFMEQAGEIQNGGRANTGDPLATLESPHRLGDYRIVREVGRGGMGVVYEAEQLSLRRRVALKVLPASFARNRQHYLRFRREARSAGRLHHTNIVPVYDIGFAEGLHYYTMQFIEGCGLDQVIADITRMRRQVRPEINCREAEGAVNEDAASANGHGLSPTVNSIEVPLVNAIVSRLLHHPFVDIDANDSSPTPIQAAPETGPKVGPGKSGTRLRDPEQLEASPHYFRNVARVGVQVAEALAFAHSQKILHRDVKPANLLLDRDGNTWVADFGLAKDEELTLTTTGNVMGTLRYLAPESLQGIYNSRCDIYSLGFTLYELTTLFNRRAGTDPILNFRPDATRLLPRPREIDSRIPKDLETVIQKAMTHDAGQRYQTAAELAEDLRRFLTDRPILARPFTRLERVWMWTRRNPREATWLATLSLACSLLAAVGLFNYFLRGERDIARTAAREARAAEREATEAERDARIRGHLAQAIAERHGQQPGGRGRALKQIRLAATFEPTGALRDELQRHAVAALATPDVRVVRQPGKFDFAGNSFTCDRDHRYLAHLTSDESIVIRDATSFDELRRIEAKGFPRLSYLRFSEQGQFLAAHSQSDMDRGQGQVWRVSDGASVYRSDDNQCFGLDISTDERWLSICRDPNRIDIVDLQEAANVRSIDGLQHTTRRALFSPDGQQLLVGYGFSQQRPEIYDRTTLQRQTVLWQAPQSALALAWHPDGQRIAIAGADSVGVTIWDMASGNPLAKLESSQIVDELEFHPSEPLLRTYSWDGMSRIWDLTSGKMVARLADSVSLACWSRRPPLLGLDFASEHVDRVEWESLDVFSQLETGFVGFYSTSSSGEPLLDRLVVARSGAEIVICDRITRTTLSRLNVPLPKMAAIHGRTLWVASEQGLAELPLNVVENEVTIGPPRRHSPTRSWNHVHMSRSFGLFAGTRSNPNTLEFWQLDNGDPDQLHPESIPLPESHDLVQLSPDGRWGATGHWHNDAVNVWDLESKTLAHKLDTGRHTYFRFLPDSQHLVTCRRDAFHIYELKTWHCTHTIPRSDCSLAGFIAFSQDGKFAAAETEPGIVDLFETHDWQSLLRLEHPGQPAILASLEFSPDNERLNVTLFGPSVVGYWDLRRIKVELAELGLPWNARLNELVGDSDEADSDVAAEPLTVRLVGLDSWQPLDVRRAPSDDEARRMTELARQIFDANPESVNAAADFSLRLSLAPAEFREPQLALQLAEKAYDRQPVDSRILGTLALAWYRSGNFEKAEQLVRDNLKILDDNSFLFVSYVLSLSVSAQGRVTEAQILLDYAEQLQESMPHYQSPAQNIDMATLAEEARTTIAPRK